MKRNDSQARNHAAKTSASMKLLALANQCPACKRKAALQMKFGSKGPVEVCRWKDCDYRREISI
jgi:hypothetical protein